MLEDMTDYFLGSLVGVYVLMRDETVLYVGQSRNAVVRICGHKQHSFMGKFNRVLFHSCEEAKLDQLEAELIQQLLPTYNKSRPQPRAKADVAAEIIKPIMAKLLATRQLPFGQRTFLEP